MPRPNAGQQFRLKHAASVRSGDRAISHSTPFTPYSEGVNGIKYNSHCKHELNEFGRMGVLLRFHG